MKKKNIDIELMRILAAFFVIFNHTGINGFFLFSRSEMGSTTFWIELAISVFCKFSVPLFFMITGALMLQKETRSYRDLFVNKILKTMLILLIWSFAAYRFQVHSGETWSAVDNFFRRFFTTNWNYSHWYLYAHIAVLLSLPILQKIAKALSDKEFVYMFTLAIVYLCVLPVVQYILWKEQFTINGDFKIDWICSQIFLYPLLGYFLYHREIVWNKTKLLLLWIINIGTILLSSYLTYYRAEVTGVLSEPQSQLFHPTFSIINAVTIFVTCQHVAKHISIKQFGRRVIESIGGATFGIYLMHLFLLNIFRKVSVLSAFLTLTKWPMLNAMLYCLFVFFVGYCITMIWKGVMAILKAVMPKKKRET